MNSCGLGYKIPAEQNLLSYSIAIRNSKPVLAMSHNEGSYYPAQPSDGGWQQPCYSGPPQNQGPAYPPQHLRPGCPPQNQLPPQNQGPAYPPQHLRPGCPPQNQLPPQNQGPAYPPQHLRPGCPPQNQLPPQNQGPCYRPQNQRLPFHPQNQGPHIPPLNQTPLFPPQNQRPPFPPQNQGSMCPPQNQRPMFSPQNQGPRFPIQNQNNGPWFPQNNGPSFAPCNQGPAYPQNNDNPESLEEYPDEEEGCDDYGEDWSNQNDEYADDWSNQNDEYADDWTNQNDEYDDGWSNQNYDHEEDWRSQPPNPSINDGFKRGAPSAVRGGFKRGARSAVRGGFKRGVPSAVRGGFKRGARSAVRGGFKRGALSAVRGRRNSFSDKGFKKNDFKEAPLGKISQMGPKTNSYEYFNQCPQKQCSNNILVNIVQTSDLDCRSNPPQDSNQRNKKLNSSSVESKQSLGSSKRNSKREVVCTKPKEDKFNLKANKNSTQNQDKQSQKAHQAQDKEIECKFKNANQDSSATSILQNNNLQSKLIQQISSPSLNQGNKQNNDSFKSNQGKSFNPKSNKTTVQCNHKPSQQLNRPQDKYKENSLQSSRKDPVLTSNGLKDDKPSQLIPNRSTKHSKEVNDSCSVKLNNSLLQRNNSKESLTTNKAQAKEGLEHPKINSSLILNKKMVILQNTSNVQQEKLVPILTSRDLKADKQSRIQNTFPESALEVTKSVNVDPKLNNSCSLELGLLQCNNKESPERNKVQAKGELGITTSNLSSTLNHTKYPLNNQGKSQITINVQREKLRRSKRLNSQNDSTSDDNTSISTKRAKTSDKALSKEEQHSPSKVVAMDTVIKSNPKMQDKIKGSLDDGVKMNDAMMDKISISQPTDKLEAKLKIEIESIKTEPHDSIIKACDGKKKEALANEIIDHTEISSEVLAKNTTNASEICSITPDSSININEEQSRINFNESTVDDKSQNSDLQINYQSLNDDSQNSSDFSEGINPLEANLREFDILDEVEGSDDDEGDQSIISSGESESEASDPGEHDVDIDDIDAMLEEGLPTNQKDTENKAPKKLRHKVILEEIGHDHFDLLPEGWIQIIHNSGMPVYLQQKSRVCTMARPYFLGPGSARSHKTPLSAIPCLQYKRTLELEQKYEEENLKKQATTDSEQTNTTRPPLLPVVSAKIETAEENEAAQSLDPTELQEYCKKVFNFKTISIIPFKNWGDRRKFARMTKDLKKQQRPLLPSGTKLLKFPIHNPDGTISKSKGEWVINPNGKSYVCILHEYVQHALRQHPKYQFKELKNPATPYSATVYIGEMQYGTGMGASKKHAKLEAAKAALEVLIPEMKDKIERDSEFGMRSGITKRSRNYENSIFDQIHIEDPRVAEFCAKTTEPPPYAILATCLQRNGMGLDEVKVEYNMNTKRHKEDEFKMTVRNHMAVVLCKNKRDGKQKAAQAILKALHPNIEHFGSLLRMYGNHSIKSVKEKKQEEQEITGLQCKAAVNQPNFAILNKLQFEMRKLAVKRKEQQARGKFLCQNLLPTASTTDLNKINL